MNGQRFRVVPPSRRTDPASLERFSGDLLASDRNPTQNLQMARDRYAYELGKLGPNGKELVQNAKEARKKGIDPQTEQDFHARQLLELGELIDQLQSAVDLSAKVK